jgi:NADH-quinone oxidoreductase subunit L
METPLVVLAVLSTFGGFVELPHTLGHLTLFSDFMQTILPGNQVAEGGISTELILQLTAAVTAILGIFIAYMLYYKNPERVTALRRSAFGSRLHAFWKKGWGFDWLYDTLFVNPIVWIAEVNKSDFIDLIYTFIAWVNRMFNRAFSFTQSGRLRWYAMGIALGAIITLTIAVFL